MKLGNILGLTFFVSIYLDVTIAQGSICKDKGTYQQFCMNGPLINFSVSSKCCPNCFHNTDGCNLSGNIMENCCIKNGYVVGVNPM